jgi:uncharacterized protein (DUF1330 family)
VVSPCYLLVEIAGEHARQVSVLEDLAARVRAHNGAVLARAPPGRVAGLEPGTVASGLLIAKWPDAAAAKAAADLTLLPALRAALPSQTQPLVLAVEGLPEHGLPEMMDIPTVASVPRPASPAGNVLLVIRGSAWDQAKLDQYRDVILPMHKERAGYYEVFAVAPGQVVALHGEWRDQIFAISRWPTRAAAEDFWYSRRYQETAIPIRLGAGRFTVHMLEATAP